MGFLPNSYFTATVGSDGTIYAFEMQSQRAVGVTSEMFEEVKQQRDKAITKAEDFYKQLVDNGIIKPEPTQEDLLKNALMELEAARKSNAEHMEMQSRLLEVVEKLESKLGEKDSMEVSSNKNDPSQRRNGK